MAPFGFNIESRLVSASVGAAPGIAKLAGFAKGTGVDQVAAALTSAASVVSPTVRNCKAHIDAENRGFELWKQAAEETRATRNEKGSSNPVIWILAQDNQVPEGAFVCGKDNDGLPWYVCRTFRRGSLHIGRVGEKCKKGAIFRFDGADVEVQDYEVLVSNESELTWVPTRTPVPPEDLWGEHTPLIGGTTHDGTSFFIARATYYQGTHPSTVVEGARNAIISFGGRNVSMENFEVLARPGIAPPKYL